MTPEDFASHPLWEELDRAAKWLTSIDAMGDPAVSRQLDDLREVLAYSEAFRTTDELPLFSRARLEEAQSAWANINSYLSAYQSNPGPYASYIGVAVDNLDAARDAVAKFPRPQTSPGIRGALSRAINEQIALLDRGRTSLASRLADVEADSAAREAAHAEDVNALTARIAALTQVIETLEARVASDESRLDKSLTTTNDSFIAAQSAREVAFKEWLSSQEAEFSKLASPHMRSISGAEAQATETLAVVTRLRTSVEDMSNLAAGDILGDAYGKSARADRVAAFVGYGVGALAGTASILIVLFAFGGVHEQLVWQQVALKFALTAAAGALAAVAFRFGGSALRRATSFKRQELELRALQPFLHSVDGSDGAKVAFINRSFGHAWTDEPNAGRGTAEGDPGVSTADLLKLLTTLAERGAKS